MATKTVRTDRTSSDVVCTLQAFCSFIKTTTLSLSICFFQSPHIFRHNAGFLVLILFPPINHSLEHNSDSRHLLFALFNFPLCIFYSYQTRSFNPLAHGSEYSRRSHGLWPRMATFVALIISYLILKPRSNLYSHYIKILNYYFQ